MTCRRCPHHVRHGKLVGESQTITFADHCGLLLKQRQEVDPNARKVRGRGRPATEIVKRKVLPEGASTVCQHFPFIEDFDYFRCGIYQATFDSKGLKNDVVPTKDFQYSEHLAGVAVTDMELL